MLCYFCVSYRHSNWVSSKRVIRDEGDSLCFEIPYRLTQNFTLLEFLEIALWVGDLWILRWVRVAGGFNLRLKDFMIFWRIILLRSTVLMLFGFVFDVVSVAFLIMLTFASFVTDILFLRLL